MYSSEYRECVNTYSGSLCTSILYLPFLLSLSTTRGQIFTLSFCTSEAFKLSLLCIDFVYTSKWSTAIPSALWGCALSECCPELNVTFGKSYSVFRCVRSKCGSIMDNKAYFKQHCASAPYDIQLGNSSTSIFSDLPSCCSHWNFKNTFFPDYSDTTWTQYKSGVLLTFAD